MAITITVVITITTPPTTTTTALISISNLIATTVWAPDIEWLRSYIQTIFVQQETTAQLAGVINIREQSINYLMFDSSVYCLSFCGFCLFKNPFGFECIPLLSL